jgi:hypothetical protein
MNDEPRKTEGEIEVLPPVTETPIPSASPPAVSSGASDKLPLGLSKKRLMLAFAIAGISDTISLIDVPFPPLQLAVDLITAALLFAVLGWRWLLLPGLIMEAVPGVAVVPFWMLVVSAIAIWGTVKPKLN